MHNNAATCYPVRLHERGPITLSEHEEPSVEAIDVQDFADAVRRISVDKILKRYKAHQIETAIDRVIDAAVEKHIAGKNNADEGNGFDYIAT